MNDQSPYATHFSRYLEYIMDRAGMARGRLARLSEAVLAEVLAGEFVIPGLEINPAVLSRLGVSQPAISKCMHTTDRPPQYRPSREQLIIWIEAIRRWYSSDTLKVLCKRASQELDMPVSVPTFTDKEAAILMHLAGFNTLEEEMHARQTTADLPIVAPLIERSPIKRR